MNKYLLNFLKFILFLGVGLSIMYFVYSKYSAAYLAQCELDNKTVEECGTLFEKVVDDFKEVNYFWIFVVLIAFTISNISRAIRWKMLIKPLGYVPKLTNAFFTIIIGYFANMFLPRVGEVVRAATMSKYEKIPVEKLIGTIVVGRTIDVICLATAVGLAFLLEFDKIMSFLSQNRGSQQDAAGGAFSNPVFLIIMAIGLLSLILFFIFRKQISKTKLYQKVIGILKGLWEGIQAVRKLEHPWLFVMHSLNIWVMYFLMTYFCFFAFEHTAGLSPLAALLAFVFGAFGILIPSPGGMGTYHFFTTEALMLYGLDEGNAFSFANILFFSVQLGCNIIIGLLSLLMLPLLNRGYDPKPINQVTDASTTTS